MLQHGREVDLIRTVSGPERHGKGHDHPREHDGESDPQLNIACPRRWTTIVEQFDLVSALEE
jgi:hypothetical protein